MRTNSTTTDLMRSLGSKLHPSSVREGATLVEFAIVAPVTFLLILALIVGGMGVFRYQETSHLAREATRYASTHGGQYQLDGMPAKTGVPAVLTSADMEAYVATKAVGLDPSNLTVSIAYSAPATIVPNNIPAYLDTNPNLVPPGQSVIQNYVTVTVTYQWFPETFLVGPINLTSTSKIAISY
ncbi:MAG: pilus assembly protein [Gemmataceae bacterium]|nr:pilus assembly protein [Gemmataceae bacterium]